MTATGQNIGYDTANAILRGTDQSILVEVETDDPAKWIASGTAVYSWYPDDPRDAGSSQVAALTVSLGSMIFASTDEGFSVTIPIADTQTASLDPGVYYHELRLIASNGFIGYPFTGNVKLTPEG